MPWQARKKINHVRTIFGQLDLKKLLHARLTFLCQADFRDEEEINVLILRRIWIRFQGASMGAYLLYVPIGATPKTDSKTSKIGIFVFSMSLNIPRQ